MTTSILTHSSCFAVLKIILSLKKKFLRKVKSGLYKTAFFNTNDLLYCETNDSVVRLIGGQ